MTNRELSQYLIDRACKNTAFVQELQKLDEHYSQQRMDWLKHSTQLIKASRAIPC